MFLERENNSGKFQNNAINDVRQISVSHVIRSKIWRRSLKDIKVTLIYMKSPFIKVIKWGLFFNNKAN